MLKILLLIVLIALFIGLLIYESKNAPIAEEQEDGTFRYLKDFEKQ
jgi:hypothetical protein